MATFLNHTINILKKPINIFQNMSECIENTKNLTECPKKERKKVKEKRSKKKLQWPIIENLIKLRELHSSNEENEKKVDFSAEYLLLKQIEEQRGQLIITIQQLKSIYQLKFCSPLKEELKYITLYNICHIKNDDSLFLIWKNKKGYIKVKPLEDSKMISWNLFNKNYERKKKNQAPKFHPIIHRTLYNPFEKNKPKKSTNLQKNCQKENNCKEPENENDELLEEIFLKDTPPLPTNHLKRKPSNYELTPVLGTNIGYRPKKNLTAVHSLKSFTSQPFLTNSKIFS